MAEIKRIEHVDFPSVDLDDVRYEKEGAVAIITINRPKALNALNAKVLEELGEIIYDVESDESIRVVIITGEGRAFVAGADISQMMDYHDHAGEGRKIAMRGSRVFKKIENLEKVTIAAVNGFALGGGCELALSCDLRIASENASFGQPEVHLGVTPGFSGTQRLPKVVGLAKAKEMILTGDSINAFEAEKIGLINKVVKNEDLLDEAKKMAAKIIRNAPIAVKYSNIAIKRGYGKDIETGMTIESSFFDMCFYTEDQKEGMSAFLEKRKADFKGK